MTFASSWLLMAVPSTERQFAGNDGYSDEPDGFYSWDSRVPRSRDVAAGDRVAVWDKSRLIGASVIEQIAVGEGPKTIYRCTKCGMSSIKRRKVKRPFFRCHNQICRSEFDEPFVEVVRVVTYRATHDAGWAWLPGLLTGSELRAMCQDPASQHAIRPLDWAAFKSAVAARGRAYDLSPLDQRADSPDGIAGQILTRVRIGDAARRDQSLVRFGEICALSGPCPADVLSAGVLLSYAHQGHRRTHGCLLLRRDIQWLFDRGRIAVDPDSLAVSVDNGLLVFSAYASLDARPLDIEVSKDLRQWFRDHWLQHRELHMRDTAAAG